jgi:NADH-ubiquinone oxidoreductase chain 5
VGSVGKFSLYYMAKDFKKNRFFLLINLFVLSMVILIISPHYVFFLIGWDGLGFSRFLLISYYKSRKAWRRSLKTFLINRLGDGLILSSMGIFLFQGHLKFFFEYIKYFLFFFCLIGLITKRAHFPFRS